MNKQEAVQILALLRVAFPQAMRELTVEGAEAMAALWASQFQSIPADLVLEAVREAISKSKFLPSIAEINERLMDRRNIAWVRLTFQKLAATHPDENGTLPYTNEQIALDERVYKALGGGMNLEWLREMPVLRGDDSRGNPSLPDMSEQGNRDGATV